MTNPLHRLKEFLAHRHVKTVANVAVDGVKKAREIGSETLDLVMRKSTDDLVREHILEQGRVNDVLAIKLDEALRRIEALEKE